MRVVPVARSLRNTSAVPLVSTVAGTTSGDALVNTTRSPSGVRLPSNVGAPAAVPSAFADTSVVVPAARSCRYRSKPLMPLPSSGTNGSRLVNRTLVPSALNPSSDSAGPTWVVVLDARSRT
jgi:hypothetical protein